MSEEWSDKQVGRLLADINRDMSHLCGICKNAVPANFKFCAHCGALNTDFDERKFIEERGKTYAQELQDISCSQGHKEESPPPEFKENPATPYCILCGKNLFD
jgi:hypothetical protein